MPASGAIVTPPNDATDDVTLRMPDTSGNIANLAAFRGQELELRETERGAYSRIHFFGTTTDGGPCRRRVHVSSTTTARARPATVQFRDWCAPQDTAAHHSAIGPQSGRNTSNGQDGARCAIFHVPTALAADKTLAAVVFPSSTTPGGGAIQSYLMALTLERADGSFVLPDLGVAPLVDRTAPRTTARLSPAAPLGAAGLVRRHGHRDGDHRRRPRRRGRLDRVPGRRRRLDAAYRRSRSSSTPPARIRRRVPVRATPRATRGHRGR